tara:strand:+ start:1350 stop:2420 length:1071 start_codon:yes stop_codon:yes gene_type:complete
MANPKEYGYYIVGNKLGIVEKDVNFDNDPNNRDYGPGTSRSAWKSPLESVPDGLKVEYTYSPNYVNTSSGNLGYAVHKFLGWSRNHLGKLLIFTHSYGSDAVQDITNLFTVGEYIHITGSEKWSGVHKIASHSSVDTAGNGILTLETQCTTRDIFPVSFTGNVDITASAGETRGKMVGDDASSLRSIESFKDYAVSDQNPYIPGRSEHYIFIEKAATATNDGFWKVTFPDTNGQIDFSEHITMDAAGNVSSATEAVSANTADNLSFYQIAYEEMTVYGSDAYDAVQNLADESDTIDLPPYLSKALVYYVKAKFSEDVGDIDKKEYFMREFRKMVEKQQNALVKTPRMISSGMHSIR